MWDLWPGLGSLGATAASWGSMEAMLRGPRLGPNDLPAFLRQYLCVVFVGGAHTSQRVQQAHAGGCWGDDHTDLDAIMHRW